MGQPKTSHVVFSRLLVFNTIMILATILFNGFDIGKIAEGILWFSLMYILAELLVNLPFIVMDWVDERKTKRNRRN